MFWLPYLIFFGVIYILTVIPRYFLFKNKLLINKTFAFIPVYSHIRVGAFVGYKKYAVVGGICRTIGLLFCTAALISDTYFRLVAMTHFYGIMLGNWEVPNIEWLFTALMWTGLLLYVFGLCCRLLLSKKLNTAFGIRSRLLDFCGMCLPFVHEGILAFSKKQNVVMSKAVKDMTAAEYALYLRMSE